MAIVRANDLQEAISIFIDSLFDKHFQKTRPTKLNERELLRVLKYFLLGYYGEVRTEAPATGGRFDYMLGSTAVEVAVSNSNISTNLQCNQNVSEMRKLRKHPDMSILLLLDLSGKRSLQAKHIDQYRQWSPGKGNHKTYPVTVLYVFRTAKGSQAEKLVLRR